jgi:Cellobiose phosphorylase
MAGVGVDNGNAEKALNSVKAKLDTKYGVMILQPAYTRYHLELGEITSYPPGYKEMLVSSATTIHGFQLLRHASVVAIEHLRYIRRLALHTSRTSLRFIELSHMFTHRWLLAQMPSSMVRLRTAGLQVQQLGHLQISLSTS